MKSSLTKTPRLPRFSPLRLPSGAVGEFPMGLDLLLLPLIQVP